jgi:hypothetical protein
MDSEVERRRGRIGARRRRRVALASTELKRDVGFILLTAALVVAGLGFGAQHVPVLLVTTLLALASLLAAPKGMPVPRVAWLLLALAAYSMFQALPLPMGLIRVLSPEAALVWEGALRPFRQANVTWASLSVDPAGTWLEVVKYSGYACLVVAAAAVRDRRGSSTILALVFGLAVLCCVVTLVHGIVQAPKIYGLFSPPTAHERWTRGPFVNGNNLAGYLNLGLLAGAGLWLGGRSPLPERVLTLGIPLLATGVVLSGSRGGVLALALAGTALVIHALWRKSVAVPRLVGGFSVVLLLAVVALFALGDGRLRGSLFDTSNDGKVLGFRGALSLIGDNPWFGVGRGAFDGAFQPYRGVRGDSSTVFVHAENVVLDWVSEWGIPVGLFALFACGYFVVRLGARAVREPMLVGAVLAVGAVLVQNQVDFGLEIFGLAAPFWIVLSLAESGQERAQIGAPVWHRLIPVGFMVAAAAVVIVTRAQPLHGERREMKERFTAFGRGDRTATAKLAEELRSAILRHPGDGYLPLLGGYLAKQLQRNPLVWLGRALERTPTSGRANLALAEALGEAGHTAQALVHLRLAGAYDHSLADRARDVAVALEPRVDALARGFPRDATGGDAFVNLCPKLVVSSRIPCFREAVRRDASSQDGHQGLTVELLDALEGRRAPCTDAAAPACLLEARRSLAAIKEAGGLRRVMLAGRLSALDGDRAGAVRRLLGECPATPSAKDCLELAADLAIGSSDPALVRQAVGRFIVLACEVPEGCAAAHRHVADRFEASGVLAGALEHSTLAAREAPSVAAWLKVADFAARAGAVATLRTALVEARSNGPLEEGHRREIERLEKAGIAPPVAP